MNTTVQETGGGGTYRGLDDFANLAAARLDDSLEVGQRLGGLGLDAAGYDLHRAGVERDAAGDEDEVAGFNRLRVWADGRGSVCRVRSVGGYSICGRRREPGVETTLSVGCVDTEDIVRRDNLQLIPIVGCRWIIRELGRVRGASDLSMRGTNKVSEKELPRDHVSASDGFASARSLGPCLALVYLVKSSPLLKTAPSCFHHIPIYLSQFH